MVAIPGQFMDEKKGELRKEKGGNVVLLPWKPVPN